MDCAVVRSEKGSGASGALDISPVALTDVRTVNKGGDPVSCSCAASTAAGTNRELKKRICGLSSAALSLVDQYSWPGSIRELRNAIERAMLLTTNDWIEAEDLTTLTHTKQRLRSFNSHRMELAWKTSSGSS
jgi:hypothetical protein